MENGTNPALIATQEITHAVAVFKTNIEYGITTEDAINRTKIFGENIIAVSKKRNELLILIGHLSNPLVILLLIAASISFFIGQGISSLIIVLMVMISVVMDYMQEKSARKASEKLKNKVAIKTSVIRSGKIVEIINDEMCLGDIVLLSAGKIAPADLLILESNDLFVNQSFLTGESFPSEKSNVAMASKETELAAIRNLVFMGSSVLTGTAKAMVYSIGEKTQYGSIARTLMRKEDDTDFNRGMRKFGMLIMKVTLILVLFIFFVNAILQHDILESFFFSIAIAVGLTPELLPMVMSVTMAKGSIRMASKGIIVKRLSAIPGLGSMEILCTDKTGTITEDKITLIKCIDLDEKESGSLFELAYINSFFQTGIKNPLDDAIINFGKPNISGYQKIDEVPFDFLRKKMSIVVNDGLKNILICKGAPEEILKSESLSAEEKIKAYKLYESLSKDGFRVLAIAIREIEKKPKYSFEDEIKMNIKGFVAFLDPPKQDADETVTELKKIGVEMKIITGDNHLVTQKICSAIGLPVKGIMLSNELELLSEEALQQKVSDITIFARFSPEQKNRVINAFKKIHRSVGYMGDGINDAPSLKTADIGISVDSATDIAKDAADFILTKKDLLVLKEGILEGRKTFENTMKYILMGLSSNFGNMFSVAIATLFLPFLPMLPAQILINNFLYDSSQIAIPTDNVDEEFVKAPRRWDIKMIRNYMLAFGLTSPVFDLATFFVFYKIFQLSPEEFRTGWFMESLATQILVIFIIRTPKTSLLSRRPSTPLILSVLTFLLVGWMIPYTPAAIYVGFRPLNQHVIMFIIMIVVTYLISAEFIKRMIKKNKHELALRS
ncbi:MAG: magnesium-translocating P-type ATPase [bacterium]